MFLALPRRLAYSPRMFVVLALLSSLMWGVADFLGGLSAKRMSVFAVVGLAQVFGLATVLVFGLGTGAQWDWRAWPWAVVAALGGDIGLMSYFKALSIGRMGIVAPIASVGAVVPMAAGLWFGEQPAVLQLVSMLVAVVGIVLASGPELGGGAGLKPVLLALLAAGGFGLAMLGLAAGADVSLFTTTTLMRVFSIGAIGALLFAVPALRGPRVSKVGYIAASGSFDVVANLAFGAAAAIGLLSVASVLSSVYPVITALLAWWLLHERLLKVQYVGVALTMLGVLGIVAGGH